MLDFDTYSLRYGECVVQDLIERLERYAGISPALTRPLEDRWNELMSGPASDLPQPAAA